jgi:hypothetical protein
VRQAPMTRLRAIPEKMKNFRLAWGLFVIQCFLIEEMSTK